MEKVILVDEQDREVGTMEKMEAHERGILHRAFSVFLFNEQGQMLLQKRAVHKYHSPNLWTNACCSHPRPQEETKLAAERRLQEELGITADLQYKISFVYRSEFENGLTEYEYDHVFTASGTYHPIPNVEEVASIRWLNLEELKAEIKKEPGSFTTWFKIAIEKFF